MDAEPDGVELEPLPLELRPWLSRSELEVEIAVLHGRLDAEAPRHAHEREVMFAEIFRLEVMLARYGPRVGKPSKSKSKAKPKTKPKPKPESVRRQVRRDKNATAGARDPLRFLLQQVKGEGRGGLLRSLCKKRADN